VATWETFRHRSPLADSSAEAVARVASKTALSTTTACVLIGSTLSFAGVHSGSPVLDAGGFAVWIGGILTGPSYGWNEAGYPGVAGVSLLGRLALLGGTVIAVRAADDPDRAWRWGAGSMLLEAYVECAVMEPYVRSHGPGAVLHQVSAGIEPTVTPGG